MISARHPVVTKEEVATAPSVDARWKTMGSRSCKRSTRMSVGAETVDRKYMGRGADVGRSRQFNVIIRTG